MSLSLVPFKSERTLHKDELVSMLDSLKTGVLEGHIDDLMVLTIAGDSIQVHDVGVMNDLERIGALEIGKMCVLDTDDE